MLCERWFLSVGKRLERHLLNCTLGIVTGDKGSGKSTLFAQILDVYKKAGYNHSLSTSIRLIPLTVFSTSGI